MVRSFGLKRQLASGRGTRLWLFRNVFGFVLVAGGGENHGGGEDECAAQPGVGAEFVAEQLDAEDGADGGFEVEEDSGSRGGDLMDAPVPEESGGGGTE